MAMLVKRERKDGPPRLFDWLEAEFPGFSTFPAFPAAFPMFPELRVFDEERAMRCEEYVEEGRFVLRAELPGIDPEKDVEISVADGLLRIDAERRETRKEQHRSEFFYGKLARTLALPSGVDEKSVKATYRDGILEVTVELPKEQAPAAKVPIEHAT